MKRVLTMCVTLAWACGDTGQEHVAVALLGQGSALSELRVDGATLRLTRAQVAFGPAYFCASEGAQAELCETALAELTDSVVIDGLSPAPAPLGALHATTGHVHSALYDYGIVFLLTRNAPSVLANAPLGHSVVLDGSVERAGETRRFRALVDVEPAVPGDTAVSAQRTEHEIRGEHEQLTVSLDPYAWLQNVDLDALFALPVGPDGVTQIEDGSQAYEAIVQGLQNRAPARFAWSRAEPGSP